MFTAKKFYLDSDVLARLLVRKQYIQRAYISLDTIVEGVAKARRCVDVTEGDLLRCLGKLLYCQRNVFEDPMVLHSALNAAKRGASFDEAFAEAKAAYLAKRGLRTG